MALIDPGPVLTMLGGHEAYRRFVLDAIGAGHDEQYYRTVDQQFLGTRPAAQGAGQDAQRHDVRPGKPIELVVAELARHIPLDPRMLRSADRSQAVSSARAIVSFVLVRRLGYRVGDVAATLGRDSATVSVALARLAKRLQSDVDLAADVERLSGVRL